MSALVRISSEYIGDTLFSDLEVRGGVVGEMVSWTAFDQPTSDHIFLRWVLFTLNHDSRGYSLE